MIKASRLPLFAILLAAPVLPLAAQPSAPAVSTAIKPARVAYVNSDAFLDEASGIKKLVKALKELEREFQPQQAELMEMSNRLNALSQEIRQLSANPAADPKLAAGKMAEGQQLQKAIKQKNDVAQVVYNRRTKELRQPVEAEIAREFASFLQERDFSVLLDGSHLGGPVLAVRSDLDVTADFIAYFNAKHP